MNKTESKKYQSQLDELIRILKNTDFLHDSKVESAIRKWTTFIHVQNDQEKP